MKTVNMIMHTKAKSGIENEFFDFISNQSFPCVGAKAAMAKNNIQVFMAGHMGCPANNHQLLAFLYNFVDHYRETGSSYQSAAILFDGPGDADEAGFEQLLWAKLQALSDLDAARYDYDQRVGSDPMSQNFSFSLKEEAFYVVGLHPASSRAARRFRFPALIFNPHSQFEKMRESHMYEKIKSVVRERDNRYSGSVNPMLEDFGTSSEVVQYSGRLYDQDWKCPIKINHGKFRRYSAPDGGGDPT